MWSIVGPLMLFGGLFIKNSRIPVYFFWLKYLSWFYYAAENMMIGQWTFEENTFYCSLPIDVRLAREEAERDVQFAEVAQTFHRSNLNCNISGENFFASEKLILMFFQWLAKSVNVMKNMTYKHSMKQPFIKKFLEKQFWKILNLIRIIF